MLAFIFDRTIGWDKHYERITYDQIENGVWDSNGVRVAHGNQLSRKTVSKCLNELIEWGVLLRRIETGCKTGPKYFYALNLGAGVGVKNRDGQAFICRGVDYLKSVPNLFQPEKQHRPEEIFTVIETVFVDGKMTQVVTDHNGNTMLAKPKRMRDTVVEKTADDLIKEEFGEFDSPELVEKGNSPQCSSSSTNGSPQWNRGTEIYTESKDTEPKNTEADGANAPATGGMQELEQIVSTIRDKRRSKQAASIEKITLTVHELESLWKDTFYSVHDKRPLPWTAKQRGQIKTLQTKWVASGRSHFGKALVWWVQRWQEVGALFFNLKDSGQESAAYPSEPAVGFLVACFESYTRAFDKAENVDDVPALGKKELFRERLKVRGWDEGKIEALVQKKFGEEKPKDKPKGNWKEMILDMGKRDLQPVAKPDYTKPPENIVQISDYKLEEWK